MIKKGYVIKENDSYHAAVPIYTAEQYDRILSVVKEFITSGLAAVIQEMEQTAARILSSHTPKHLQDQVTGIASMDNFVNAVCIPATILIERKVLCGCLTLLLIAISQKSFIQASYGLFFCQIFKNYTCAFVRFVI